MTSRTGRLALSITATSFLSATAAQAIPAFARKTGLACTACHEVWPRLNDFGQLYRDRGFRLERGRDAPVQQEPGYWPIAFRTTAGYQFLRQALQPTDAGPSDTQTGTFGFSGLDLLTAGTLGEKVSFLVVYTPALGSAGFGRAPQDGDLESAWAAVIEPFDTGWLNFRVGKHALDLPIDEHRSLTLTQGYSVYHFHPQGSAATFEPGENQAGLEVWGHSEYGRLRYSVSLFNENGGTLSGNVISSPVVWAHLQGLQYLENEVLVAVKGGLFGAYGMHPTTQDALTDPAAGPAPVVGTGRNLHRFLRAGAELHLRFLSHVNPLTLSSVFFYGSDDQGLIQGVPAAPQDATWAGGLAELTWSPTLRLTAILRAEVVHSLQAGDPAAQQDLGDQQIFTAGLRYNFEFSNRSEVALHLEASRTTVQAIGTTPDSLTVLSAIDFTF